MPDGLTADPSDLAANWPGLLESRTRCNQFDEYGSFREWIVLPSEHVESTTNCLYPAHGGKFYGGGWSV